jgi:hypothetical protein
MIRRIRSASSALFMVLALVIALTTLCASVIVAQEEGPVTASVPTASMPFVVPDAPVPGGPGFYSQSAFAFRPYPDQNVPYYFSGRTLFNTDTASHSYEAMVSLPQGATITKFVVWYRDNNPSADIWAAISRAAIDDSSVGQIARVDSSGAVAGVGYGEDTTITDPTVDMQSYTYWVETYLPPSSGAGIVSFRIDYSYSGYLPLVTK